MALEDVMAIEDMDAKNLATPTTLIELETSLMLCTLFYGVTLGRQHALTLEAEAATAELVNNRLFYNDHLQKFVERPIQILLKVNSRVNKYVLDHETVADFRTIAAPNLSRVLADCRIGEFVAPDLPGIMSALGSGTTTTDEATDLSSITGASTATSQPDIHIYLDGASLSTDRSGKRKVATRSDAESESHQVKRCTKEGGTEVGEDANLKSKVNGKSLSKIKAKYPNDLPKIDGQYVCLPFVATGSCWSRCGSLHLHQDATPADVYKELEKLAQKIGASN